MNQYENYLQLMRALGGDFAKALVECYYRADAGNRERLLAAFPEYFDRYKRMFAERGGQ